MSGGPLYTFVVLIFVYNSNQNCYNRLTRLSDVAKEYNPVVSFRIPPQMLAFIDEMVDTGLYRNRPDVILAAIRLMQEQKKSRESPMMTASATEKQSEEPRLYQSAFLAVLAGLV